MASRKMRWPRLGVASNTISRGETATYRPTIEDLEKLARFFGKSILYFFPRRTFVPSGMKKLTLSSVRPNNLRTKM